MSRCLKLRSLSCCPGICEKVERFSKKNRKPRESTYGAPEQVRARHRAELGSAFLSSHCGLPSELQHATYIETWLQALKGDKRLIFSAASMAQKAADFLLPAPEVAAVAQAAELEAA